MHVFHCTDSGRTILRHLNNYYFPVELHQWLSQLFSIPPLLNSHFKQSPHIRHGRQALYCAAIYIHLFSQTIGTEIAEGYWNCALSLPL